MADYLGSSMEIRQKPDGIFTLCIPACSVCCTNYMRANGIPIRPDEVQILTEEGLVIYRQTGALERVIGGASKSSVREYSHYLPVRDGVSQAITDLMLLNRQTPNNPVSCSLLSGVEQAQPTLSVEEWYSLRDFYIDRLVQVGYDQSIVESELGSISAPDNYEGTYCTIYQLLRPRICSTTQCNYSDTLLPRILRRDLQRGLELVRDMLLEPSLVERVRMVDDMVKQGHRRR